MRNINRLYAVFIVSIILHVGLWFHSNDIRTQWGNVPPVPGEGQASSMALGDQQFAYRMTGLTLQNLGDTGGRSTALTDYDYQKLSKWLFLMDKMDSRSDYAPFLAAFYFGATPDKTQLPPIVDFLEYAGERTTGEKWRWLAHAMYLARFEVNDLDRALGLANKLANLESETHMPAWTKQMPAFIQTQMGNKEAAYEIMLNILKSRAENLDPAEVSFTQIYMCDKLIPEEDVKTHPLCQNLPD